MKSPAQTPQPPYYHAAHRAAQGRAQDWYRSFRVRVCRVERGYGF